VNLKFLGWNGSSWRIEEALPGLQRRRGQSPGSGGNELWNADEFDGAGAAAANLGLGTAVSREFLLHLIAAVPYKIHTVLTVAIISSTLK